MKFYELLLNVDTEKTKTFITRVVYADDSK